jgi:hypothetical protein
VAAGAALAINKTASTAINKISTFFLNIMASSFLMTIWFRGKNSTPLFLSSFPQSK